MANLTITPHAPTTVSTITATAFAFATGGTSPYTYQWYSTTAAGTLPVSYTAISGATLATLSLTGLAGNAPEYVVVQCNDNAAHLITSAPQTFDWFLNSTNPAVAALTTLGNYASNNGNSVVHQQAGHTVQIFPDPTVVPQAFLNAVSVIFKATNPTTGASFTGIATTGVTNANGAYGSYVTTGSDFLTAGTWNCSLQILNLGGTLVNTAQYALVVA